MNPLFLLELIHTTVVPALIQKNWLFFALGIPGFTLAESADLVTSIVQGDEAEPQVLAALHMLSGCASSHTYLLSFVSTRLRNFKQNDAKNEEHPPPPIERTSHCRSHSHTCPRRSRQSAERNFA